ncbi:hypothetical protein EAO71_34540 [Streptomyces sp. ms191]|nr:hypothetical protein EAO71_34540 [Streptomyces sp. ms191]
MTTSTTPHDLPGPPGRGARPSTGGARPSTGRHPLHGVLSTVVLLALAGRILHLLLDMGRFTATEWSPSAYEEFLRAGRPIASDLDYDLPFIPVAPVISPICIGMCVLLSWFATRVAGRERRSPRTRAGDVVPAGPGTLLPPLGR